MTTNPRQLMEGTLRSVAEHWAEEFQKPSISGTGKDTDGMGVWKRGRSYAMSQLFRMDYKDEFENVVTHMDSYFDGHEAEDDWKAAKHGTFDTRSQSVFEDILARKLAIDPEGNHIPGMVGSVIVGQRTVSRSPRESVLYAPYKNMWARIRNKRDIIAVRTRMVNDYWNIYAGETWERNANDDFADHLDQLPPGARPYVEEMLANVPKMNNLSAIDAVDAITARCDLGSTAATIRGLSGAQPADVDTVEAGTLLFELTCSATAFGAGSDDTGKATCTAAAITDDASANATDTLGYCRLRTNGTGVDDIFDGEAGTASADFIFNTLSIVSGTNVSMSALTISVSE